jgi:hypothetical protein
MPYEVSVDATVARGSEELMKTYAVLVLLKCIRLPTWSAQWQALAVGQILDWS